jgi:hypothetical protein
MKNRTLWLLASEFLLTSLSALAQDAAPSGPPKMLQIFREQVKPGHNAAHAKLETGWPAAFRKANFPVHYIALRSISGINEAWYVTGHDSFASIAKEEQMSAANATLTAELDRLSTADGEHLESTRALQATYMPEISYNPDFSLGKTRYFMVITTRLRPGKGGDYVNMMKRVKAAHERAKMSEHYLVYAVGAGMPNGTYLMFIPMETLDEADRNGVEHSKQLQAAYNDDERDVIARLGADVVQFTENAYFAVAPGMSYPSERTVAVDPGFWNPKPVVAEKKDGKKKMAASQ